LGLSTLSVFFRPSAYTNVDALVKSLTSILLTSAIVACFANYEESDNILFKWGSLGCLGTLVSVVILYQVGIPVKKVLPEFAGFNPVFNEWNQKYYAAWLVFIMWGTVSFHWRKNTLGMPLATGIIVLTGVAIFTGYSDAAKGAFILSIIIFVV